MEKLIFQSPERATEFVDHVENRIKQEQKPGVSKAKEIVSQELVKEFEIAGHGVQVLSHPWEHTQEEHGEAQQLVNISFTRDLTTAIAHAEKSPFFPRNIDLFHDLLTGEMYDAIFRARKNTQQVPVLLIIAIAVFFTLFLGAILVFAFTL
ncbi:MAG: hypothetical protein AAB649_00210 [Patescibacteria group bacterium]